MIFISNYALQTYYHVAVGILEEIQKEEVTSNMSELYWEVDTTLLQVKKLKSCRWAG